MKNIFVYLFLLLLIVACDNTSKWKTQAPADQNAESEYLSPYEKQIAHIRDSTSVMFLSGANGVLEKGDISKIGTLHYFPVNEKYRVRAAFTAVENGEVFEMQTSTDRLPEYRRFGKLGFEIQGQELVLTLYQNVEQPDYLFLPFKDLTNGKESYGAGRYLDFKLADLKEPIIDFNLAYNPYCAYNKDFTCPIPPRGNHLAIALPAGEKKWH